jgi:SAM-dependent methyltransferase
MDHGDHLRLLGKGIKNPGGVWADFGSGRGAFTLALAELLSPGGQIHSVDIDVRALEHQKNQMGSQFPKAKVFYHQADFTRTLDLPLLDGAVMANALHFQPAKEDVLSLIKGYLRPGGGLILVEYDTDLGNQWVPHPISFPNWVALAARCGFAETALLATAPSRFMGRVYSALSTTAVAGFLRS